MVRYEWKLFAAFCCCVVAFLGTLLYIRLDLPGIEGSLPRRFAGSEQFDTWRIVTSPPQLAGADAVLEGYASLRHGRHARAGNGNECHGIGLVQAGGFERGLTYPHIAGITNQRRFTGSGDLLQVERGPTVGFLVMMGQSAPDRLVKALIASIIMRR